MQHNLDNDTPLLPEYLAERITGREQPDLALKLADKARYHYATSRVFRQAINRASADPRETLLSFYNHWLPSLKS